MSFPDIAYPKRVEKPNRSIYFVWLFLFFLATTFASGALTHAQQVSQNTNKILEQLRIWHSPNKTRLVFDVSASTEYKTFVLHNPLRLVVDLDDFDLPASLPNVEKNNKHVSAIRSGKPAPDMLRVVFDLKRPIRVKHFLLAPNKLYGHRLVVDIFDETDDGQPDNTANKNLKQNSNTASEEGASADNSEQGSLLNTDNVVSDVFNNDNDISLQSQDTDTGSAQVKPATPALVSVKTRPLNKTKFVVAIDAGHGGDDPGAIGHRGTREKKLTLSIAKKLHRLINKHPGMRAELIRTGDYYIKLKGRRQKARTLGADIFISIHADAFTKKSAHGMSVFALSQRGATSAMASTLAAKENASDLIGGVSLADKDDVLAKVLVDLSMTNTISESVNLGGRVLVELAKLGRLHSKRVEQANFSVLRSPDVPSILIEAGFITNPNEESKLRSSRHQAKFANAVYKAIKNYYEQTPYANQGRYGSPEIAANSRAQQTRSSVQSTTRIGRHKVRRGDTLSTIAQRYNTSLRELKRLNNIKHNTAMLGVNLKVPITSSSVKSSKKGSQSKIKNGAYTVRNGDSLSKISAKFNVTIKAIKRENGLRSNVLKKGQTLKIPGLKTKQAQRFHIVGRGDTLSELAQKYGVSMVKIKTANKLRSSTLHLGKKLIIPH